MTSYLPYECGACTKQFATEGQLARHISATDWCRQLLSSGALNRLPIGDAVEMTSGRNLNPNHAGAENNSNTFRTSTDVPVHQQPLIQIPPTAQQSIHHSMLEIKNPNRNTLELDQAGPRPRRLINGDVDTSNIIHAALPRAGSRRTRQAASQIGATGNGTTITHTATINDTIGPQHHADVLLNNNSNDDTGSHHSNLSDENILTGCLDFDADAGQHPADLNQASLPVPVNGTPMMPVTNSGSITGTSTAAMIFQQNPIVDTVNTSVSGVGSTVRTRRTSVITETVTYPVGVPIPMPYKAELETRYIDPRDKVMAQLYLVCDKARAPKHLADTIVRILHKATLKGEIDLKILPSKRDGFTTRMDKTIGTPVVESVPVRLETGRTVTVQRLDFQKNLQAHLSDVVYSNLSNLDLPDPDHPFSSLVPEGTQPTYCGIQQSNWYKRTSLKHRAVLQEGGKHILHPLLLYVDKTPIDMYGRYSVEPVMITSSLLSEEAREDFSNWIILGLIPNLKSKSPSAQRLEKSTKGGRGKPERDYHLCLQTILQPLISLQKQPPLLRARRGDEVGYYYHILPIAAVMGDNLSSDTLCCSVKNKSSSSIRITRRCLTPYDESDCCPHKCVPFPQHHVHRLSMGYLGVTHGEPSAGQATEYQMGQPQPMGLIGCPVSPNLEHYKSVLDRLTSTTKRNSLIRIRRFRESLCGEILKKVYGAHPAFNAFQDVDFGSNPHGITKATVSDILHVIEEGIVPRLMEILFEPLSDTPKTHIDNYVSSMFSSGVRNKTGEKHNLPRMSFTNGYTSLTQLTANERVGQLFVLSILLHSSHGKDLISKRFELDFDEQRKANQERSKTNSNVSRKRKNSPLQNEPDTGCSSESDCNSETELQNHAARHPSSGDLNQDSDSDDTEGLGSGSNSGMDEDIPSTRRTQPDTDPPFTLTTEQLFTFLGQLGLGFLVGIHEELPQRHKDRLVDAVRGIVTSKTGRAVYKVVSGNNEVSQLLTEHLVHPEGLLDYSPVDCMSWTPRLIGDLHTDANGQTPSFFPAVQHIPEEAVMPIIDDNRHDLSISLNLAQFTTLVESILGLHSLLKYGTHLLSHPARDSPTPVSDQFSVLAIIIENIRSCLVNGVKRDVNTNQFRIQKFVELSHFLQDVYEYGCANGFDSHVGERGLKSWAKDPASQAQKRDDATFSRQVIRNVAQTKALRWCSEIIYSPVDEFNGNGQHVSNAPSSTLKFSYSSTQPVAIAAFRNRKGSLIPYPDPIFNWFVKRFVSDVATQVSVHVYTEVVIGQGPEKETLRANPRYAGNKPWFDFVMVNYGEDTGVYPARIAAFFLDEGSDEPTALIQQADYQSMTEKKESEQSLLFQHFHLDSNRIVMPDRVIRHVARLVEVPVSTLSSSVFCVDTSTADGGIFDRDDPVREKYPFPIVRVHDRCREWPVATLEHGKKLLATSVNIISS